MGGESTSTAQFGSLFPTPGRGAAGFRNDQVGGDVNRRALGDASRGELQAGGESDDSATVHPSTGYSAAEEEHTVVVRAGAGGSSDSLIAHDAFEIHPELPTVISKGPPLAITNSRREIGGGMIGQRLEYFELLELVGGGGMGLVFRALDSRLNRVVALKVLISERGHDEETVRRFRNEAQSAARLDHDNIARVHYVGEDRGLNFIVFEFIEGVNIRDLVARRGPLTVPDAISYTIQIADALAHASSRDVVHRDIKPSNVLITSGGRAKLVDMGLARLHQVEQSDELTASGVTLGTFDYISPEQAYDPRSADVRSDIYSLGCTLYFMLAGRPPFPEGNVLQKLLMHKGGTPPDPRDLNPETPEELSRIVRKMLAKEPSRRFQRPAEVVEALGRLSHQLGLELPGLTSVAPTRPAEPAAWLQHIPWLAPTVVLLATLSVLPWLWSDDSAGHTLPGEMIGQTAGSAFGNVEFENSPFLNDLNLRRSDADGRPTVGRSRAGEATFPRLDGSRSAPDPSAANPAGGPQSSGTNRAGGASQPGDSSSGARPVNSPPDALIPPGAADSGTSGESARSGGSEPGTPNPSSPMAEAPPLDGGGTRPSNVRPAGDLAATDRTRSESPQPGSNSVAVDGNPAAADLAGSLSPIVPGGSPRFGIFGGERTAGASGPAGMVPRNVQSLGPGGTGPGGTGAGGSLAGARDPSDGNSAPSSERSASPASATSDSSTNGGLAGSIAPGGAELTGPGAERNSIAGASGSSDSGSDSATGAATASSAVPSNADLAGGAIGPQGAVPNGSEANGGEFGSRAGSRPSGPMSSASSQSVPSQSLASRDRGGRDGDSSGGNATSEGQPAGNLAATAVPPAAPFDPMSPMSPMTPMRANSDPPGVDSLVETPGLLVVSPAVDTARRGVFPTLKAAVEAARNGDVIELRYTGRREESPVRLNNLNLTIRAGEGHRPIVVFRPTEFGIEHSRALLTITGGDVKLLNVGLFLDLPLTPADGGWGLISLRRADARLQRCVLTIANSQDQRSAFHRRVSFLQAKADPRSVAMMPELAPADDAVQISLQDCVARGEATLLDADSSQSVSLTWQNGLLTTTEYLTRIAGAAESAPSGRIHLQLDHLTAHIRRGFCLLVQSPDQPHLAPLDVQCTNSILIGSGDAPLVELRSMQAVDPMNMRLSWSGSRNVYEGFSTYWKGTDLSDSQPPQVWDFDQWRTHWGDRENLPWTGPAGWSRLPEPALAASQHRPDDFELDMQSPARNAASDGADVGFMRRDLPSPAASPPTVQSTSFIPTPLGAEDSPVGSPAPPPADGAGFTGE